MALMSSNTGVRTHQATCYLLIGGGDGMLVVSAGLRDERIAALTVEAEGGFGGPVWAALASSLVGLPLEREAIVERITRFHRAGVIPEELDLEPFIKTLLRFGRRPELSE